eukprot:7311383-Ditylum_brightwellii.AAC.1
MSRKKSAKTDDQAQGITDNTTHSSANSGEKLEEQSGRIRIVPSNRRRGSDTKNKNIKGIPVPNPAGVILEPVKPENSVTPEIWKN